MNRKKRRPPSYYKKLIPCDMKDELLLQIKKCNRVVYHDINDVDYSYLKNKNYIVAEIHNPYSGYNLYIEFSDKFILYFAQFCKEYDANLYDYNILRKDLKYILKNNYCIYSVFINNNLVKTKIQLNDFFDTQELLISSIIHDEKEFLYGNPKNIEVKITSWRDKANYNFIYRNRIIVYINECNFIRVYFKCKKFGECIYCHFDRNTVFVYLLGILHTSQYTSIEQESIIFLNVLRNIFLEKGYKILYFYDYTPPYRANPNYYINLGFEPRETDKDYISEYLKQHGEFYLSKKCLENPQIYIKNLTTLFKLKK